jgi:P4 family phage/plasmid primase-like protien
MKPNALKVNFDNIPMVLKMVPRWVLWRFVEVGEGETKRWSKIPFQTSGVSASSTKPATWTDFLSAQNAYQTGRFDGVGFVFDGSDKLVGVDLDDCYDDQSGGFTNAALQHVADSVDGYMEVSPSGTGVKIFTLADLSSAYVDHDKGFEAYSRGRYFTVTGHKISGEVPNEIQDLSAYIPERTIRRSGDDFADYSPPLEGYDLHRVETEILSHFDPESGYTDWLTVGMALHHQFQGDIEACELWDRWSYQDGNCSKWASGACDRKWSSFNSKGGATLRSLVFKINQRLKEEALARGDTVLGQAPMENARTFLETMHSCEEGTKLVHYSADFFQYTGTHYEEVEEATVRSEVYKFLDKCKKQDRKGNILPFPPTPPAVSAVMDATKALTHLENHANTKPPVWLRGYGYTKPDAEKLISLQNGLFHLEESVLLPHSLGFFTQNSLPFSYDSNAQCPMWEKFLKDVWGHDQESIDTLQEMFGYILSGDTKQQKFFNIIGPRRSGKGTINRVLVELLGKYNTVAPELGELCDTFGLQPWIGKLLASFTDARAPERNRGAVVSQLLRIVGGDTVTVNRKNKEAWNGYLPTRIVIYSNEVLQLTENSNALTGRMIVLKMTNSFFGREDAELSSKLLNELSGIFNWSMEGLRRRVERGGHFVQPKTGVELLEVMEELSNPIGTFVNDALEFDVEGFVCKDDLFACFKHWCTRKSIPYGTDLAFKRRFIAATQDKAITSDSTRIDGDKAYIYRGIKLNKKAQKFIDGLGNFKEDIF